MPASRSSSSAIPAGPAEAGDPRDAAGDHRHDRGRVCRPALARRRRRPSRCRRTAWWSSRRRRRLRCLRPIRARPAGYFRGLWRVVDVSRRVVLNLIFLLILAVVIAVPGAQRPAAAAPRRPRWCSTSTARSPSSAPATCARSALGQLRGETTPQKMQLRDVLAVLDTAAKDDRRSRARRADPRRARRPTGLATLREIAAALDRFRATGKKVVAWGSQLRPAPVLHRRPCRRGLPASDGQRSTSRASAALRNYYKDALDKLGVSVNLLRVGTYKSVGEPYIAQRAVARGARGRQRCCYGALVEDLHRRRSRRRASSPPGSDRCKASTRLPQRFAAVGGDSRQAGARRQAGRRPEDARRAARADDRARRRGRRATKTFRQVSFDEYLGAPQAEG